MNSNHFIITKDWLQEIICLFGSKPSDNPFKDVFFRCNAKCSHCGYTIGYNLVSYFEKATMIIWDKDCDTDILLLDKSNWELVDIDALSPEGNTVNTIPCLPIPSFNSLPLLQWEKVKNTYTTSKDMLSDWFSHAICKREVITSSEITLTEEIQTYVNFLQKTNLGIPHIRPLPKNTLIRAGNTDCSKSGILLILNK